MEHTPDIIKSVADSSKKTWNKPVFEIISKNIIKSGAVPGVEGALTPTHLTTSEHS